jgi:SAM-dependent methyltransferase
MGRLVPDVKRAAEADRAEGPERPRQPPSRPIAGELPPLPEVRGPGDLPDLAKYNFGVIAHRYARSMVAGKPMQRDNGETLLRLVSRLIDQGKVRRPEAWLDAGCGTGLMASLCDQLQTAPEFRWLRYAKTRVGFDYSPQMLSITNNQQPDPNEGYTHLVDGDCRWFGRDNLFREAGVQQVDLILMNNVLHWLFTSDAIERALHQSYEMLDRFGGCVAASIAAVGTGSVFYGAYKAELEERLEADQKERWRAHIENPIGLQSLDTIVDIARKCRFRIERAQLTYEPKEYDSTDEYVRDVRAYGEAVLMAPLLHLSPQERERVWSSVSDRFRELHRAKFNQAAYVHNQFMIYLVAVRND